MIALFEILILAVLLFTPLIIIAIVVYVKRKNRQQQQQTSALGFTIPELRASPNRLVPMRGQFRKVCMISGTQDTGGQYGGSAWLVYETFLVDRKGIIHNLEESTDNSVEIEDNARWLADQLGIPFEGG